MPNPSTIISEVTKKLLPSNNGMSGDKEKSTEQLLTSVIFPRMQEIITEIETLLEEG